MLSSNPIAFRRKSSLEIELQEIQDERASAVRRKSLGPAVQILFLEMDLHGLCATRSFSNRKILSYLHDNINMFDDADYSQNEDSNKYEKSRNAGSKRPTLVFGEDATAKLPDFTTRRGRRNTSVCYTKKVSEVPPVQLKDIRRIEYVFNSAPQPLVFVRRHCVIISFTPIRIIILADRLLLFVDKNMIDGNMRELFVDQLQACMDIHHEAKLTDRSRHFMSFELFVYEAVFGAVIEIQKQHLSELEIRIKKVSNILKLYSIVPVEVNEKARGCMDVLLELTETIKSQRRVIAELLEDKDTLALMHLSKLKEDPTLYEKPLKPEILSKSEETDALLESYLMDYNAILSRLKLTKSQLEGAQAMVSYRLELGFNQMLIGETVLSVMSAALSVGIYMGGLAGMNIGEHGYENERRIGFQGASFISTIVIIVVCVVCILIMQRFGILPKSYNSIDIL